VISIQPKELRELVTHELKPLWKQILISKVSPLKVSDNLYVNCNKTELTSIKFPSMTTSLHELSIVNRYLRLGFAIKMLLQNELRLKHKGRYGK
jgi:hypothetical protein